MQPFHQFGGEFVVTASEPFYDGDLVWRILLAPTETTCRHEGGEDLTESFSGFGLDEFGVAALDGGVGRQQLRIVKGELDVILGHVRLM